MAERDFQVFLDELLSRTDIVSLINRYVPLIKKGNNHVACCPFHVEKTPSFSVNASKQFFYCFGCGEGGNSISFIMKHQRLPFMEAVALLAEQAGMQMPQQRRSPSRKRQELHNLLYGILDKAATQFVKNREAFLPAKEYLKKRGLSKKTIEHFRIGYAANRSDSCKIPLNGQCDEKQLLQAGLLAADGDSGRTYSRFRHRIMFPIRDQRGRVLAFGGRSMDESRQPKYLNSPETPVFQKGRCLYGLYEITKAGRCDRIIVVEGYMDLVALFEKGINNVVATLGTAVTAHHVRSMLRICKKIVFCFDGDEAGRRAAGKALDQSLELMEGGQEIKFSFLPQGQDPDDLVKRGGAQAFTGEIDKSRHLSEFLFFQLSQDLDLNAPEGRAGFAERAGAKLGKIKQSALARLIGEDLARRANLDPELLLPRKTQSGRQNQVAPRATYQRVARTPVRTAIGLLLTSPELARHALADHRLRQLKLKGATLLIDMLEKIRHSGIHSGIVLLEQYRDSEYADSLQKIYIGMGEIPDLESEFTLVMNKLEAAISKESKEKEIQSLLRQYQQGNLNQREKEKLRKLLSGQSAENAA